MEISWALGLIIIVLFGLSNIVYAIFGHLVLGTFEGYALALFFGLQGLAWFFVGMMYEERK